ncbi:hypothetical protein AB0F77_18815 [Streptomyces sp. NPDC026672]|uniref:hypothetical protein n=1 Tax=unclassified Streptomyces TaxID=2593676 RepID=UPI0033F86C95
MSIRVRSRKSVLAAVAFAAALSLAAVTPALAGTGATRAAHSASTAHTVSTAHTAPTARTAAVSGVQGDPRDITQRVADFYGAYIDSVWDNEDPAAGANATALRSFYLSADAQRKVAAYEAQQHADGILFAQNVPVKWAVSYTGSGAGHATDRVTLTWSDGADAQVTTIDVLSDLRTRKIIDLKQAG